MLFVEDEETLRVPIAKMLRSHGFSVIEAVDGHAAIELFCAQPSRIDVVLLDLTLPGMSGKDVLAELRRIRPSLKVVLTTAFGPEVAADAAAGHRDWAFIQKPYRISALSKLLRDTLAACSTPVG